MLTSQVCLAIVTSQLLITHLSLSEEDNIVRYSKKSPFFNMWVFFIALKSYVQLTVCIIYCFLKEKHM